MLKVDTMYHSLPCYHGEKSRISPNVYPEITCNLDVLVEINTDYKLCLKMFSLEKVKVNAEALHYCYYMILLKLFLRNIFLCL